MPQQTDLSGCSAALVNVNIIDANDSTIVFETDAKTVMASNHSPAADRRIRGRFTCSPSETWLPPAVWTKPPPVPEPSVALAAGQMGPLYLTATALRSTGQSARGDCVIRGSRPDDLLSDEQLVVLKWPDCFRLDHAEPLKIIPTEIKLTGFTANNRLVTLNLLDTGDALPAQDIRWTGASAVTVRLTQAGVHKLVGATATDPSLPIWPVALEVSGSPAAGGGFEGKVDLRDLKLAAVRQQLCWKAPAAGDESPAVSLQLTSSGFQEFGVLPEDVKGALRRVLAACEASPGLWQDFNLLVAASRALHRWHDAPQARRRDGSTDQLVMDLLEGRRFRMAPR